MKRPNFFIVGFGRSGTTSLYNYLRVHPDIYMPPEKEPNFFCTDVKMGNNRRIIASTVDEYLALFAGANEERAVGEASTLYILSEAAAQNIFEFAPRAKIIILIRNPVDMLYSWHSLGVRDGYESEFDFQKALDLEQKRIAEGFIHPKGSSVNHRYRYVIQRMPQFARRYVELFGSKQVLFLSFDRLKAQPQIAIKETLAFLEVDTEFSPDFKIHNSSRSITRPRYKWLTKFLQEYGDVLRESRRVMSNYSGGLRFDKVIRKLTYTEFQRQELQPEIRSELLNEFKPTIEELESVSGIDLSNWFKNVSPP